MHSTMQVSCERCGLATDISRPAESLYATFTCRGCGTSNLQLL